MDTEQQDPDRLFQKWLSEARGHPHIKHPTAMCLSTIQGEVPQARFIDVRAFEKESFVFSTNIESDKARAIGDGAAVALTFFWDALGRQVRIDAFARRVAHEEEAMYFATLPRRAQVMSHLVEQGAHLADEQELRDRIAEQEVALAESTINRPESWGSFRAEACGYEFLSLATDRIHQRERFEKEAGVWKRKRIQP